MSPQSKKEYTEVTALRYKNASRSEKKRLPESDSRPYFLMIYLLYNTRLLSGQLQWPR
jgi:hypothetical protein